jgi:diacylglycerol kinase (ATP)
LHARTLHAVTVAVLLNPAAGRGRNDRLREAILTRLRAGGHHLRVLSPGTPEEADTACRAAVAGGAAGLVAVGGDGTMHLALQAVAGTGVPFGIVPAGTGNDFAVEAGLPADPLAAADTIAAALAAGRATTLDLARLTGPDGRQQWFAAVLGAGFDAIVNERANRMRFPRGPRRYDLATFIELVRLRPRAYTMRLDGVEHRLDAVLVAIGNTASYGGGHRICPDADATDGLLDVLVGARMSRTQLARIKPTVLTGTHVAHPLVSCFRARTVELSGEPITTYADGERAYPLPITVASVPGALALLC